MPSSGTPMRHLLKKGLLFAMLPHFKNHTIFEFTCWVSWTFLLAHSKTELMAIMNSILFHTILKRKLARLVFTDLLFSYVSFELILIYLTSPQYNKHNGNIIIHKIYGFRLLEVLKGRQSMMFYLQYTITRFMSPGIEAWK